MQPILRKFRLLLSQLRGKFSPSCRVDYINGSDTFPPPLQRGGTGGFCPAAPGRHCRTGDPHRPQSAPGGLHCQKVRILRAGAGGSHLHRHHRSHQGSGDLLSGQEDQAGDIRLQVHRKRILMVLRKNAQLRGEISIDEPLSSDWDGNELLLSDILGTDEDIVSRDIENEAEREMLLAAVSELGEREQEIMQMRFGLCGKKERTQKEVAEAIGISQSYISRLEKKIIRKLRKKLEEADQPIVHTT